MKAVAALLCVMVGGCFAATTVEVLANDPNMSTLVSLVTQAGLVDAINGGTFTIFAPNNAAFAELPSATLTALGNDVTALQNVLKYHVVPGSIHQRDATNELQIATLNGQNVRVNIYTHNNAVTIQGAQVLAFDREASNGVIHTINHVMMPPTGDIVDLVAATGDVSTLLSLVQQAGIANVLKGDALTVFAPTNAAFAKLPASVVSKITADKNLLTEILEYHVVPHTEYSAGLYNRESLRTMDRQHDRIVLHASSSGIRVNTNGNVIKADIGTTNGVVHLIDHVLIPARYYLSIIFGRK